MVVTEREIKQVMEAFKKNNGEIFYVEKKDEIIPFIEKLVPEGSTVGFGGSQTLFQTGVMDHLRSGRYNLLDRDDKSLTPEEVDIVYRKIFFADWYFASTNAITLDGYLYNVDGNSNRVTAITFGPKNVLLVVGINKIVKDLAEAEDRVANYVAPKNAARQNCKLACVETGKCIDCHSPSRNCCSYLITKFQRRKNRIKVLLVGESIGY